MTETRVLNVVSFVLVTMLVGSAAGAVEPARPRSGGAAATTRSSDLPQPTRVTIELDNTPADEALIKLFKHAGIPSGNALDPGMAKALRDVPVTARIVDEPFLLALLEICRQAHLEPQFTPMPDRPLMFHFRRARQMSSTRVSATTRATTMRSSWSQVPARASWVDGPASVGGPLVIIATAATRTRQADLESGAGVAQDLTLNLNVLRDPGLRLFAIAGQLVVDEATDDAGRSLRIAPNVPDDPNTDPTRARVGSESWRLLIPVTVPLAYSQESRALKLLRGRLAASVVTCAEPVEIIIDGASVPGEKQAGKIQFSVGKLEESGDGARLPLTIRNYPPGPDAFNEIRTVAARGGFRVLDPPGAAYSIEANLHSHTQDRVEGFIQFRVAPGRGPAPPDAAPPRLPRKVVWDVPVEVTDVSIPVEFKDLPLPARGG